MSVRSQSAAVLLLLSSAVVAAHGHDGMKMEGMEAAEQPATSHDELYDMPSYAGLGSHAGLMMAHIAFMVLAWFFVLPIGVVFSIGRSRLAFPVQLLFLILNGLGVLVGTIYNINTPDLYEHNAHHSIGWVATWVMTAQVIMSLLFVYAGRTKHETLRAAERAAFLPASLNGVNTRPYHQYRWSGDSGQGTEPPSPARGSRDISPSDTTRAYDFRKLESDPDDEEEEIQLQKAVPRRTSWFRNRMLDKYLSARVPKLASKKVIKITEIVYEIIDRTVLILGFIAMATGVVTYTGIFRGHNVFTGLAHFIKGGIFFWYGLLTLGRWMGCFADFGWAWNVKPTRSQVGWKVRVPSAEFTESFLIFFYGITNVFLEHLGGWGGAWTAQDFEHVSIAIMFFGGGLAGMLIESSKIRTWLNTSVDAMPLRTEAHPEEAHQLKEEPKSYSTSLNPMPALVILLLGLMMSSHHQDLMVSTMVHKQWGTLLCGAALARGFTYITHYLSPPKSIYPSRPPTEIVAAFCLISGGLVFMSSAKDIMFYMDKYDVMAMFTFTVTMGFTSFVVGYEIFVLGLKGWAVRRELKQHPSF